MAKKKAEGRIMYWVPGPKCCSRVEVVERLVVKETDCFVWVDRGAGGHAQERRDTAWGSFHPTWEEAYARLHSILSQRLEHATLAMVEMSKQRAVLESMKTRRDKIDAANGQRVEANGLRPQKREALFGNTRQNAEGG